MTTQANILIPNLVIGGAPKCGTSSLYNWLNDHPEVCGSVPKETFFLMDEDHPLLNKKNNIHKNGLEGYSLFFEQNTKQPKVWFEATTHYLYQKTALNLLTTLASKPIVIFLLRDPSYRMYSSFEYTKNNLAGFKHDISFIDFAQILLSGQTDALDKYIDRDRSLYVLKQDLLFSKYIVFLEEWKHRIGSDRIFVFLFEELTKAPKEVMQKISNILGIDNSFYETYPFTVKNETLTIKSIGFHKAAKKYSSKLPSTAIKRRLKDLYLKIQTGTKKSDLNNIRGLKLLNEYFASYNERLAKVFDLDISVWNH